MRVFSRELLPKLEGTEGDAALAFDIRTEFFPPWLNAEIKTPAAAKIQAAFRVLIANTSARWWIENRSRLNSVGGLSEVASAVAASYGLKDVRGLDDCAFTALSDEEAARVVWDAACKG